MKGKLQCYQGIDSVLGGKIIDGVKLLKDGYSLLNNNPVNSYTKVLTFQILALCESDMPNSLKSFDKLIHGQEQKEVPYVLGLSSFICGDNSKLSEKALKAEFVLEIHRKMKELFGQDVHLNPLYTTASSILNLGYYKEALQSQKETLAMRQKLLGEEHLETAVSWYQLGCAQVKLEDYQDALHSHKEALTIRHKLFGEQHVDTAASWCQLGCTQLKLEDYQDALQSHKKALAVRQKLLGEQHVDTAASLHELGCTQYKLGDLTNALDSFRKALKVELKLLGDHEHTLLTYDGLASTLDGLDQHDRALETREKSQEMRRRLKEQLTG